MNVLAFHWLKKKNADIVGNRVGIASLDGLKNFARLSQTTTWPTPAIGVRRQRGVCARAKTTR